MLTEIRADGLMLPRLITWEDGMKYEVDRVIDVRPGYAAKAGGQGDRYTIMVSGKETYLFFEHNTDYGSRDLGRWFVERRE